MDLFSFFIFCFLFQSSTSRVSYRGWVFVGNNILILVINSSVKFKGNVGLFFWVGVSNDFVKISKGRNIAYLLTIFLKNFLGGPVSYLPLPVCNYQCNVGINKINKIQLFSYSVLLTSKLNNWQFSKLRHISNVNDGRFNFWNEPSPGLAVNIMASPGHIRDLERILKHLKIQFKVVIKDVEK